MYTHTKRRARERRSGFTLIEMMVVIAIIASLTAAVGFGLPAILDRVDRQRATTETVKLAEIADTLLMTDRKAKCPTPLELKQEGLLRRRSDIKDPWDQPYRIECPGSYAIAVSAGPDKTFGTDDDITSEDDVD